MSWQQAPAPERQRSTAGTALQVILLFVGSLYVVELFDQLSGSRLQETGGVEPRETDGIDGILFAPVLHGPWSHLFANTLPLLINGTSLDVDKVMLFPGAYAVTTGTDYVSYGDLGQLTVKSTSDYLSTAELQPTLTPEGEKAYVAAVKASARGCLQRRELSPDNCPNEASNDQYKIDKSTIKWSQRGTDPYANLQPRLDYENPNIAVSRPSLQLEVKADCDSSSGRCDLRTYSSSEATTDLTEDPLAVQWVD